LSIFIETSVQIARLLSHSDEKQHIDIIALQIPDGDLIWSIDRDFVGLAKALNLQLFSPPPMAEDQA